MLSILAYLVLISGFIFWLLNAPDFRFCFSILLCQNLLFLVVITKDFQVPLLNKRYINVILQFCFVFYITISSVFSHNWKMSIDEMTKYFVLGKDFRELKFERRVYFSKFFLKAKNNESLLFYIPKNENAQQCFDVFPCSHSLNEKIILRGNSLQDGFKQFK